MEFTLKIVLSDETEQIIKSFIEALKNHAGALGEPAAALQSKSLNLPLAPEAVPGLEAPDQALNTPAKTIFKVTKAVPAEEPEVKEPVDEVVGNDFFADLTNPVTLEAEKKITKEEFEAKLPEPLKVREEDLPWRDEIITSPVPLVILTLNELRQKCIQYRKEFGGGFTARARAILDHLGAKDIGSLRSDQYQTFIKLVEEGK